MKHIQPQELEKSRQRGDTLQLLDVRTPAEHAEIHVPGVQLMPLDRLDGAQLTSDKGFVKARPLYVFCRSGSRAAQAAEKLEQQGFTQCHVVEGGTLAWAEAGLPVNRGTTKVMSLERQVRIAAGGLVLCGVLLSQVLHPGFVWLSAFIGAGLVFAGITDWCGMGLLIARMPWNQRGICCEK